MSLCKTQSLDLETDAASIALSPDENLLAVVGSHLFKIYALQEDGSLTEHINIRSSKNQNLNYSSSDVEFCPTDERVLASASTNGSVIIWNINESGRVKFTNVFKDHDRTVNRINFHPTQQNLVLSGSQDGQMKLFDYRTNENVQTYSSNSESVRDIQFNPHIGYRFAAGTESRNLQLWDMRSPGKCEHHIPAHHGPVFALDWHPVDRHCIATASRDHTIKIWDVNQVPTVTSVITTVAAVARVKWRPNHHYHLASCSLTLDNSAYIWDVQRPFVPLASFAYHRETTMALHWRRSTNSFITVSKKGRLYHHRLSDAHKPRLRGCPFPLAVSPLGHVAFSVPTRASPVDPRLCVIHRRQTSLTNVLSSGAGGSNPPTPNTPVGPSSFVSSERLSFTAPLAQSTPTLSHSTTTAITTSNPAVTAASAADPPKHLHFPPPNLGMRNLATYEDIGPVQSEMSVVTVHDDAISADGLRQYGLHYRLEGGTDEEFGSTCDHNAAVAERNERPQESEVWKMLKMMYVEDFIRPLPDTSLTVPSAQSSLSSTVLHAANTTLSSHSSTIVQHTPTKTADGSRIDEEERRRRPEDDDDDGEDSEDEDEGRKEGRIHNADHLVQNDIYFGDGEYLQENDPVAAFTAIQMRNRRNSHKNRSTGGSLQQRYVRPHHKSSVVSNHSRQGVRYTLKDRPLTANEMLLEIKDEPFEPRVLHTNMERALGEIEGYTEHRIGGHFSWSGPEFSKHGQQRHLDGASDSDGGGGCFGSDVVATPSPLCVSPSILPVVTAFDFTESVVETLKFTAFRGDMATCVTILMALGDRLPLSGDSSKSSTNAIPPEMLEHWYLTYIDQLQRLRLFNRATVLIQNATRVASVQQLNQSSTLISLMCPQCQATLAPRAFSCTKCRYVVNKCSWCQEVVAGLYVVCQGCGHGGHLHHLADWFRERSPGAVMAESGGGNYSFGELSTRSSSCNLYGAGASAQHVGLPAPGTLTTPPPLPNTSSSVNPFMGAMSSVFASPFSSSTGGANFTLMGNLVCPAGCGHLCQFM